MVTSAYGVVRLCLCDKQMNTDRNRKAQNIHLITGVFVLQHEVTACGKSKLTDSDDQKVKSYGL